MRLNVNLATRPYEDVGKFLARWGMLTLLFAIASIGLIYYSIHNWRASSDVNKQIARMQDEMSKLDKARATAVATLNEPENKSVADQSKFLNSVIQRKSLSWTRIFMDLERIMPNQLHVLSIVPELNAQNQLIIHLSVAGESRDKANDLVRRMEESQTFRQVELRSESTAKTQGSGDVVQFEITSLYVPGAPEQRAEKTAMANSGGAQ